jgi:hypothetical protein
MTPDKFLKSIVDPTLKMLADWPSIAIPFSDKARVLVLAICGQESNWTDRRQLGGPARGYPQFELLGGVAELFQVTPRQLSAVCASLDIPFHPGDVFEAMAWNDTLAISMARFLLWQDPAALPAVGAEQAAYDYYIRNWRPGMPSRQRWGNVYQQSRTLVNGTAS